MTNSTELTDAVTYQSGDSHAVVAEGILLYLVAEVEYVRDLWDVAIDPPVSLSSLLEILTRDGLSNTPPFGCVLVRDDTLTVLVRGNIVVEIDTDTGTLTKSGQSAHTWIEYTVTDVVDSISIGSLNTDDVPELPLLGGVVRAGRITARKQGGYEDQASRQQQPTGDLQLRQPHSVSEMVSNADSYSTAPSASEPKDSAGSVPEPIDNESQIKPSQSSDDEVRPDTTNESTNVPGHASDISFALEARISMSHARVEVSSDHVVELDRPCILGRAPQVQGVTGEQTPRIIHIDNPYVSSTHLKIHVEGQTIFATDVSSNGTLLLAPGHDPVRLVKDEPTEISGGCQLRIADDMAVAIRTDEPSPDDGLTTR